MSFKQGQTYKLTATIDPEEMAKIAKIVFALNNVKKEYTPGEESDMTYEDGILTIPLTQEDTLGIDLENAKYEMAIRYIDGETIRSRVQYDDVLETIIEEVI